MPFYYRPDAPSIPTKKPGGPSQGSPLRNPGKQSIPDMTKALKNLDDILAYTMNVYGGDRSTYWTNRNTIDAQYDYNQKRKNAGLKPLAIADPQWNPTAQDDDANVALAQWYRRHGSLPRDDQQIGFNRLLKLYRAEKRAHGVDNAAQPGFDPKTGTGAILDARPVRAADDVTAAQITQGWKNAMAARAATQPSIPTAPGWQPITGAVTAQPAQGPSSPTAPDAQPTWDLPTATLQGKGGGLSMLWGNNMDAPSVPSTQNTPQANEKSLYQKIDEALVPVSKWTGRMLNAPQALYLNAWNALFNAVQGRPVEYNPDITGAQYAAERAAAVGAPEANIPERMANFIQNDETRKTLANALGLSEESSTVDVIEGVRRFAAQLPYEAATDPTTLFGIGEIKALGRGGRFGKLSTELKAADNPLQTALDDINAKSLAQEAERGYTQAGRQATGETLEDAVAAARKGVENLGNIDKIITEIEYKPSSGVILKANPNKIITVLGNFKKDMINIINEMGNVKSIDFGARNGGFNVLNVPDNIYNNITPEQFWEQYNKRWLDMAINRGDDIVLATKPEGNVLSYIDRITGKEVITGFGREYNYLIGRGYVYDAATNMMKKR